MPSPSLSEIAGVLAASRRILMFTHVSPDGDAIGSLLGLGWLLREQGKDVTMVDADPVPPELLFLPGVERIANQPPEGPWDVIVALDASDIPRLGSPFQPARLNGAPLITIDHHVTNLRFGAYNWVDPSAAATAQIIVHLADAWGIPITKPAAICLLAGLVTDTRGFRTSNVTIDVLATAMRLMESGADLAEISERTLNYKPLAAIRLWGPALEQLQVRGPVIWTHVTRAMREQVQAPDGSDSGLVSFLLEAPEASIAAVFTEKPNGRVEVSLRARPGLNIADVALALGGGGHPQAAGCSVDGPLAEAEVRIIPLLLAVLEPEGRS
jgi:bifunctional oligoribonuclease and PAP phosphatase NrnA